VLRLLQLDAALLAVIAVVLVERVARVLLVLLLLGRRAVGRGRRAVLALVLRLARGVAIRLVGAGLPGEPAGAVGGREAGAAAAARLDAAVAC